MAGFGGVGQLAILVLRSSSVIIARIRGAGAGRGAAEELLQFHGEDFTAGVRVDDIALLVDQNAARDAGDAVLDCHRRLLVLWIGGRVEGGSPRYAGFFHVLLDGAAFFIEADAEHVKAFFVVLAVVFEHVGNFSPAWAAPSGPEVDEDDLAAVGIPV
jgi:hypothetical protein